MVTCRGAWKSGSIKAWLQSRPTTPITIRLASQPEPAAPAVGTCGHRSSRGVTPPADRHPRSHNAGPPGFHLQNAIRLGGFWPHKALVPRRQAGGDRLPESDALRRDLANQALRKSFTITGTPTVERELCDRQIRREARKTAAWSMTRPADLTALMAELNKLVAVISDQEREAVAA